MPNPIFTFRNCNSRSLLNFTFRGVIDVSSFWGLFIISSAVSPLILPTKAQESKYLILAQHQRDESYSLLLGAGVRHSAHGKGHEEGGLTYAKAGSSLRSPPGNPQASTPITRACLLYYFVLSPTPLTLRGAVPHHLFRRRS